MRFYGNSCRTLHVKILDQQPQQRNLMIQYNETIYQIPKITIKGKVMEKNNIAKLIIDEWILKKKRIIPLFP